MDAEETVVESARPSPSPSLVRGEVVGRYVVLSVLGAGGMGVVYAAYDPELDRKVALKLLHAQARDTAKASEGHRRLLREAQAMAKLSHPNVITVHDVGERDSSGGGEQRQVFLAMEFVEGRTLNEWLSSMRRTWRESLDVFIAAGRGLAAAHAKGLIHRDFKPDNVMIGSDGRVRVMDFGLARTEHGGPRENGPIADLPDLDLTPGSNALGTALTRHGALVGTPAYMAPEQWLGEQTDARTDQFSFCVALWEALYGGRPFAGDSINALAFNVSEGKLRSPPRGHAPGWLRRAVTRGLSTIPEQRFASMEELLSTLQGGRRRARNARVFGVLGSIAACAGALLSYERYDTGQREKACAEVGSSIDQTWNADARTRVREGLAAAGVSYALTTAENVMPWLDRQAENWKQVREELCLDATVANELDADTYERALWCLEERRTEHAALTAELERADVPVLQRAVAAAAGLQPVSGCADPRLLAARPPPPRKEDRPAVSRARSALRRARLLGRARRIDEANELLRAANEDVEALDWPPLSASARFVECYLLDRADALGEAEQACIDAYMQAAEARAWDVAADAATRLVYNVGYAQARAAEGRVWARHAQVVAGFAGDPLQTWEAERVHYLAYVETRNGDRGAGRAGLERALAIWEGTLGGEHPYVAEALNGLGNSAYSTGDYREAIGYYERALRIYDTTLGTEHPHSMAILTNLGMLHETLGEHARAKQIQEHGLAIKERAFGSDHVDVAYSLVNLALVEESLQNYDRAAELGRRAVRILERDLGPEHPDLAQALNNLGSVVARLGNTDEARMLHERALTIREKRLGPDHPDVAMSLAHLGRLSLEEGQSADALSKYERAVEIFDAAAGLQPDEMTARFGLADALTKSGGDRARALAEAERAAAGYRELGAGKAAELAVVEAWLAEHED